MLTMEALTDPSQVSEAWLHLQNPELRVWLPDGFPADLATFAVWLALPNVRGYVLQEPFTLNGEEKRRAVGLFVFNGIEPNEQCSAHVFIWKHHLPPAEVLRHARVACGVVMTAFNLVRINGLTPTTNLPARIFLSRVGFKVEGTHREALKMMDGFRADAWSSAMTRSDCKAALSSPIIPTATLEEELTDLREAHLHDPSTRPPALSSSS